MKNRNSIQDKPAFETLEMALDWEKRRQKLLTKIMYIGLLTPVLIIFIYDMFFKNYILFKYIAGAELIFFTVLLYVIYYFYSFNLNKITKKMNLKNTKDETMIFQLINHSYAIKNYSQLLQIINTAKLGVLGFYFGSALISSTLTNSLGFILFK